MEQIDSPYQTAIGDFVEFENGSLVVTAVAGSGKTTTIVKCAKRIPTSKRVAFVAFNKSIATELKSRLPLHVVSSTLNSMGYSAYLKLIDNRRVRLESRKTYSIIRENLTNEQISLYASGVQKLVGLAKAHGLVPTGAKGVNNALMMDTEQNWADLLEKFGVEFEGKKADPAVGIDLAREVLRESISVGRQIIDFDDQLYLPVIWGAAFNQYDIIFVDECQDVSAIQRAMLRLSLVPGGRLIAVGDKCQAIYGFRGADTESVNKIIEEFDAKELPLSISYRCPRAVVAEAKKIVPYIESSDTAPEGKVETLATVNAAAFDSTDAIICRLTAPIIVMAYALLRNGKACKVLGREIGQGLITLVKKMDADSISDLEEKLHSFETREVNKLIAKGKEEQAAAVEDRVATVKIFIGQLKETARTIDALIDAIENLFADDSNGRLTLCTIHKSKGLEWNRVFILNQENMPSKWARQAWQKQQESNCRYVAITRAKQELYYIRIEGWKDNEAKAVA